MRKQKNRLPKANKNSEQEILTGEVNNKASPDDDPELVMTVQRTMGPLPPPDMLAQYEEIHKGVTEILLTLTIKEQDHQHKLDLISISHEKPKIYGSILVSVLMVLGGVACGYFGQPYLGALIATTGPLAGALQWWTSKKK